MEYAIILDPMSVARAESSDAQIKQAEILMELKFPPDYPYQPPMLRLIRPGLRLENPITTLNVGYGVKLEDSMPSASEEGSVSAPATETGKPVNPLSLSMQLEDASRKAWSSKLTVIDIVKNIKESLIRSGARVDMTTATPDYGLPTVNSFWRRYTVRSPKSLDRSEVETSGKIILPVSAIEEITRELETQPTSYGAYGFSYLSSHNQPNVQKENTIIFEVSGSENKRLFCGVLEFTADPGQVCLPQWIMDNLGLKEGSLAQLRRVNLPKGTFVKMQPHDAAFHNNTDNPKAMLEWLLPDYVALTSGETLVLNYHNTKYYLDVLEVAPGRAISLIDTNLNLEFAAPKHGEIKSLQGPTFGVGEEQQQEQKPAGGATVGGLDISSMQQGIDYEICSNCKQPVAKQAFMMHEARCARINWRCDKCCVTVPTSQREEHMKTQHAPVACEMCSDMLDAYLLQQHKVK